MADYIDRDWLYEQMNSTGQEFDLIDALEMIENFPAADVVPVVRCKDCKHKGWVQEPCHGKSVDFCHVWDSCINNIDKCFCYYGERKEGAGNGTD